MDQECKYPSWMSKLMSVTSLDHGPGKPEHGHSVVRWTSQVHLLKVAKLCIMLYMRRVMYQGEPVPVAEDVGNVWFPQFQVLLISAKSPTYRGATT